jgi:hypothetical protein
MHTAHTFTRVANSAIAGGDGPTHDVDTDVVAASVTKHLKAATAAETKAKNDTPFERRRA